MDYKLRAEFSGVEDMQNRLPHLLVQWGGRKLEVKHDRFPENEIVINGVECECGFKEHPDLIHYVGDTAWCDSCFDHFN